MRQMMLLLVFVSVLGFATCHCSASPNAPATRPTQVLCVVEARPERPEYALGQKVVIVMRIENISGTDVTLDDRFPAVARVSRNGEALRLSKAWIRQQERSEFLPSSWFGMTMAPGDVCTQYFDVGQKYDLSLPGEYRVQILHPVLPGRGHEPVQQASNETTFRVVAKQAPATQPRE